MIGSAGLRPQGTLNRSDPRPRQALTFRLLVAISPALLQAREAPQGGGRQAATVLRQLPLGGSGVVCVALNTGWRRLLMGIGRVRGGGRLGGVPDRCGRSDSMARVSNEMAGVVGCRGEGPRRARRRRSPGARCSALRGRSGCGRCLVTGGGPKELCEASEGAQAVQAAQQEAGIDHPGGGWFDGDPGNDWRTEHVGHIGR